jgi:uncharacterized DUF497 family protein
MDFECDEKKREWLLNERGLDIYEAALIFEGVVLTRLDNRQSYGEVRMI